MLSSRPVMRFSSRLCATPSGIEAGRRLRCRISAGPAAAWAVLALLWSVPASGQQTALVHVGDTVRVTGYAMWLEDGAAVGRDAGFEVVERVESIRGDTLRFAGETPSGSEGVIVGRGTRTTLRVRRGERRQYGRGALFGGIGGGLLWGSVRLLQGPDEITASGTPSTAGENAFQGWIVGTVVGAVAGGLAGLAFQGPNWVDVRGIETTTSPDLPGRAVEISLGMSLPRPGGSHRE